MASSGKYFAASFLQNIDLSEHENRFLIHGFEGFIDILLIDGKDFEILGISSQEHKDKIRKAVDDLSVDMLLKTHNLEYHIQSFHQQNIKTVKDLKEAKIDDEWLKKLGINQTGHRKRFSLCVKLLQTATTDKEAEKVRPQEQQTTTSLVPQASFPPLHPDVVAIGYWHRPDTLPDLSHDFLCVKGYLNTGQEDSSASDCLEFLLDSASDVVTAREEIIQKLGLKFLKNVKSHGVHTVEDKPLYEGYIRLGKSEWIKVEVQPGEYESVGSTVMKEFFHFINGNFHQWIPYSGSHQ